MAPTADPHTDGRVLRGRRTREQVLDTAAQVASVEGLEGLTIGRLAAELGMSKSGLFAHFGSKEELQLATTQAATDRFVDQVIKPGLARPRGRQRLEGLFDGWLDYMRDGTFQGGCFFTAVRVEYDSRPAGPVRDAVAADHGRWLDVLERTVRGAQDTGELRDDVDAGLLAFELDALGSAANLHFQLHRDDVAFTRARAALAARLDALAAA
ncbi:TetR/AcrR family transcriptional regulator [Conexibacter sp. SYSU D00693]|uniref:TetR/AcrR family transcriptional regulator n=1 Tax=Conexibacter sp. SYSU D00693 TaxID=2812560 RepID=UPI00196A21C9|nr:TetR/AcrR family transcriptional regulator [Conexibacter sp. SYSU D00693]